ncbi:MAG: hypothetical protein FD152_2621 [Xanthobacteraceae bacterium]|nr:MAG: hypothetical protein FD152_2621 [Xanthobacteraceae bacterium]
MSVAIRPRPLLLLVACAALVSGGCSLSARRGGGDVTGSIPGGAYTEQTARAEIESLAARYRSSPDDAANAMRYGRALRATGQAAQAVAVLERVAIRDPRNLALMGEYGRALADVGRHDQALQVLGRAHRPDQPDWRIYNVQASIYDQMGRSTEAQALYNDALKSPSPRRPARQAEPRTRRRPAGSLRRGRGDRPQGPAAGRGRAERRLSALHGDAAELLGRHPPERAPRCAAAAGGIGAGPAARIARRPHANEKARREGRASVMSGTGWLTPQRAAPPGRPPSRRRPHRARTWRSCPGTSARACAPWHRTRLCRARS